MIPHLHFDLFCHPNRSTRLGDDVRLDCQQKNRGFEFWKPTSSEALYCVVRLSTITMLKTSYECNSTSWTINERMKESTPGCSNTCWYTHYKNLTCHNITSYPTTTQPTNNHIGAEFTWSTLVIDYFPSHAFSSLPYVNNVKYCISSHTSLRDQRHCGKI